jgi:hypothetical protein
MNVEKELSKVVTKCLLNNGFDAEAIKFVLSNYDLTSYLLDDALRIMSSQVAAVTEAVAI